MRLILTRPEKDARPLAEKLQALGHEAIILPLLEIVPRRGVVIPAAQYQAVCITSANGLANASLLDGLKHTRLLCVGPQSAAAARAAGFTDVTAAGGDVAGLTAFIAGHLKPSDGPLLYLSGAATSGDLEGRLQREGFPVTRVISYDAVSTTPQDLAHAVTTASAVLLYSPRTARLWVEQIERSSLAHHMLGMTHLCLSQAVAAVLPDAWPRRVAAVPEEAAMLAALESLEPSGEQE
ncbi:MAG: uroporphyrinogen-III synthase [Rhizobiales bacterium]|nr:uroporphyrinogen-III synthase [Hyphomicrobiales bacterium]